MNAARTTAGLIGDLLASTPENPLGVRQLATLLKRHRTGVLDSANALKKAGAVVASPDPEDGRRNVYAMTTGQAAIWKQTGGRNLKGVPVDGSDTNAEAMAGIQRKSQAKREGLRYGIYNDGAIIVEGLTKRQLVVPAEEVTTLSRVLAGFPEGALRTLCESALKPAFALAIDGKNHPLSPEQTASFIEYIEQLPASAVRGARPGVFAGVQAHGTDHRVHRLGHDEDAP